MESGNILVIDDEVEVRGFVQMFFEDRGYNVEVAQNGEKGLEKFKQGKFDLVVCDMLMPRMLGIHVLKAIKDLRPDQRVIMMTGVKEDSMVAKAKELGCLHYLTKPIGLQELEAKVNECLQDD